MLVLAVNGEEDGSEASHPDFTSIAADPRHAIYISMDAECESGNCGSRRFHVGDDGFTYCTEGHRQSRAGLVTARENDLEPTGRRSVRKVRNDDDPVVLSGREGLEHYIACFQLLLWKQVHSLVTKHGFPAELETVVRDLWTLKLAALQPRLGSHYRSHDTASQLFSSQGETSDSSATSRATSRQRSETALPRIIDAITLLFAGIVLLRLPVTLGDIHNLISDGELIYYRGTQDLAPGMKPVLAGMYHQYLDPRETLRLPRLQAEAQRTMSYFSATYSLTFPPMNAPLVLWGWQQNLSLPLELHTLTLSLANHLRLPFTYTSPRIPENQLALCLTIATKLLHPPDGIERFPHRPTEPSALAMDWVAWSSSRTRSRAKNRFRRAMETKEADVPSLTTEEMDGFINLFGEMYSDVNAGAKGGLEGALCMLFPLPDSEGQQQEPLRDSDAEHRTRQHAVETAQSAMKPVRVIVAKDADVSRPGSGFARFRTVKELSGHAKELYEAVAECTGMELSTLVREVFALERRVERDGEKGMGID